MTIVLQNDQTTQERYADLVGFDRYIDSFTVPECSDLLWLVATVETGGKTIHQPVPIRGNMPDFLIRGEVHRLLFRWFGFGYRLVDLESLPYCPF